MITKKELNLAQKEALTYFRKANIVITKKEKTRVEVVDFGLSDLRNQGLEILVYVNTDRCCAKELILFPRQTCAEHRHPKINSSNPGKEETFRCRWGKVYLYVSGTKTKNPYAKPPKGSERYYTVRHEIILNPGDQYTMLPDTLHWFQAGTQGAVVSEFSTTSIDEADVFTDPRIQRITIVK